MNSTITCNLPITKFSSTTMLRNVEAAKSRPPPRILKILIVDDNKQNCTATAILFFELGHEVDLAHQGILALRMAAVNRPDVVLLNTNLRCVDGCDVAGHLRTDYPHQPPLVIRFAYHADNLMMWRSFQVATELPLNAEGIGMILLLECGRLKADAKTVSSIGSFQPVPAVK